MARRRLYIPDGDVRRRAYSGGRPVFAEPGQPCGAPCCGAVCGCPGSTATRPACCCLDSEDPEYCGEDPSCECACIDAQGGIFPPCCCLDSGDPGYCGGSARCSSDQHTPGACCESNPCGWYHPADAAIYWQSSITAQETGCHGCSSPSGWHLTVGMQGSFSGSHVLARPGAACRTGIPSVSPVEAFNIAGGGEAWDAGACRLLTRSARVTFGWGGSSCSGVSASASYSPNTFAAAAVTVSASESAGAFCTLGNSYNGSNCTNTDTHTPGGASVAVVGTLRYGVTGSGSRTVHASSCTNNCFAAAYQSGSGSGTFSAYALPVLPCPQTMGLLSRGSQVFVRPMWVLPHARTLSRRNTLQALRNTTPAGIDAARAVISGGAMAARIVPAKPRGCSGCNDSGTGGARI